MKNLSRIAAIWLVCGAALAPAAQAKTRHVHPDVGAYTAIAPDARAFSWREATPYPYAEDAHQTATGGPSGGLPGGS